MQHGLGRQIFHLFDVISRPSGVCLFPAKYAIFWLLAMRKPFVLFLLLLFLPLAAGAQVTWTGTPGDGVSWNDPDNWDLGSVPGTTDDVIINTAAAITIPSGTNIAGLTLDASITLSTGTLNIIGFLDIGSNAEITSSTVTYKSAAFTVAAGGVVEITGNITTGDTVDVKAAGDLTVSGSITSTGLIELTSGGNFMLPPGLFPGARFR
jgi:hypothetical protein